ncbi:MAG: Bax inhibitor-1 family protein [Gemmataceae bacterium]|nr:Bax inhibitor-1 family protein [Gemmataceae bacterium]MDW8264351.1 Bax inhibitor-1 family protein [Gemmataceae bacterium]
MSYQLDYPISVAEAPAEARAAFIRRTYGHLAGAILAFIGLEALLLQLPGIEEVVVGMAGSKLSWLVIIAAFMGVSYLADAWARSDQSPALQYVGLGLYVAVEAVIFLPLLYMASVFYPSAIQTAGILTLMVFGGLTVAVFTTRGDYSSLGPILSVGGFVALGTIIASMIFGFSLGLFFCFAMVALASGSIIYQTSNILHHYRTDQHVAASLALFASVMLLFWYILRIILLSRRD